MKKTIFILIILVLLLALTLQAQDIKKYNKTVISKTVAGSNSGTAYAVNTNNGSFVVAWTNTELGSYDARIYSTLVTPKKNGKLKISKPIMICDLEGFNTSVSLAFDKTTNGYMAVWVNAKGFDESKIYGRKLNNKGQPEGEIFTLAAEQDASYFQPRIIQGAEKDGFVVIYSKKYTFETDGLSGVFGLGFNQAGEIIVAERQIAEAGIDEYTGWSRDTPISRITQYKDNLMFVITRRFNDPFVNPEVHSESVMFSLKDLGNISSGLLVDKNKSVPGSLLPVTGGILLNWFDFLEGYSESTVQRFNITKSGKPKKKGKLQTINGGKEVSLSALAEIDNNYYCFYSTDSSEIDFVRINSKGQVNGKPGVIKDSVLSRNEIQVFTLENSGKVIIVTQEFLDSKSVYGNHVAVYCIESKIIN